jgi:hypothetical protein
MTPPATKPDALTLIDDFRHFFVLDVYYYHTHTLKLRRVLIAQVAGILECYWVTTLVLTV